MSLRNFFNFLGISDVKFVYAEALNKGESSKAVALAKANLRLVELAA